MCRFRHFYEPVLQNKVEWDFGGCKNWTPAFANSIRAEILTPFIRAHFFFCFFLFLTPVLPFLNSRCFLYLLSILRVFVFLSQEVSVQCPYTSIRLYHNLAQPSWLFTCDFYLCASPVSQIIKRGNVGKRWSPSQQDEHSVVGSERSF